MSIVANSFEPLFNTGTIVSSESTSGSILNFGAGYKSISITNLSFNTVSYVKIGVGSITATTADFPILPGAQVTLKKDSIAQTISYITPSGGGRLEIIAGQGHSASGLTTYSLPALDFPFAAQKNTNDIVSGSNLITFTRASTATFVGSNGLIQTAGVDVPRFDHNPTTGESLGLLVEEQRTNLLLRSEEVDNAIWIKAAGTVTIPVVTANQIIAPNGTNTADKIDLPNVTGAGAYSIAYQSPTQAFTTQHTVSCYLRGAVGGEKIWIMWTPNGSTYSRTECILTTSWQRFSVTYTTSISGLQYLQIGVDLRDTTQTAQPAQTFYIWGAQIEEGAFATSYIPTTTAAVTRNADVASITGANFTSFYNQTEGTILVEFGSYGDGGASRNGGIVQIDNGSAANRIGLFAGATTSPVFIVDNSSVNQVYISSGTISPSATSKIAGAYKVNDFARAVNGLSPGTDTSGTVPTVNQMLIGTGSAGVLPLCGTIRRLAYYPRRLSNIELQMITS